MGVQFDVARIKECVRVPVCILASARIDRGDQELQRTEGHGDISGHSAEYCGVSNISAGEVVDNTNPLGHRTELRGVALMAAS